MRIGLLGGTFNPIHKGHIALVKAAKKSLKLDKVIFVPAYLPVHKKVNDLASPKQRLDMIRLAIKKIAGFKISNFEISRRKKTYSVQTVSHFKKIYPKNTEIFFLIGSDSLKTLNAWKDLKKLFKICTFACCKRPGFKIKNARKNVLMFNMTPIDASSSAIRWKIKNKKSAKSLLPFSAWRYIIEKKLYQ